MKKKKQTRKRKPCRSTGRADGIGNPHDIPGTATCLACAGRGADVDKGAREVERWTRPSAEALTDALVTAVEAIVRCGDGREPERTLEARARQLFVARKAVVDAITGQSRYDWRKEVT